MEDYIEDYINECIPVTSLIVNKVGINCCWNQVDLLLLLAVGPVVVRSRYPTVYWPFLTSECSFESNFPHKYHHSCLIITLLLLTHSLYAQIGKTYRNTFHLGIGKIKPKVNLPREYSGEFSLVISIFSGAKVRSVTN